MSIISTIAACLLLRAVAAASLASSVDHTILGPVSHHIADRSDFRHLSPSSENQLQYLGSRLSDSNQLVHTGAQIDSEFLYPTVVLDHSSHVKSVTCLRSLPVLNIDFTSPDALAHVKEQWNGLDKLLFLSSAEDCHQQHSGQYGYFLAQSLDFNNTTVSVSAHGEHVSAKAMHNTMKIQWGEQAPVPQSRLSKREPFNSPPRSSTSSKSLSSLKIITTSKSTSSSKATSTSSSKPTSSSSSQKPSSQSPSKTSSSTLSTKSSSSSSSTSPTVSSSSKASSSSSSSTKITSSLQSSGTKSSSTGSTTGSTTTFATFASSVKSTSTATSTLTTSSTSKATTCISPTSTIINGLPAARCGSGFDAALDGILGTMNLASDSPSLIDAQLLYFLPNTGLTAEAYLQYTNNGTNYRMVRRGWFDDACSWVEHNVIAPVVSAAEKAADELADEVANAFAAVVSTVGKVLIDVVNAALHEYSASISLAVPISIGPPAWMLDDSPWGSAYRILTFDEDGLSVNYGIDAASLAKLTGADELMPTINTYGVAEVPKPSVNLYCVDCGINGHLTTTGTATYALIGGIVDLSITLAGNIQAAINLGIDAYMQFSIPIFEHRILTVGVPGLSIPDIITIGPMLTLDADATVEITAEGQILAGLSYSFSKFSTTLDIMRPWNSHSSGFNPIVAHNFIATGTLDVLASLGLPVGIGVGISILNEWDYEAAIVDRPALGLNATWQGQYVDTGGNGGSGEVNSGTCSGVLWDVNFYNELYFTLGDNKYSIGEWDGPSLAHGCIGGTPVTNCSNAGLQIAYFVNTNGDNNDPSYSNFDPTYYYNATPGYTGTVTNAGNFELTGNGQWFPPGSTQGFSEDYFILEYRGYLYAKMTGTYTFQASNVDDIVLVWIGAEAYTGYNRGNAFIDVTYTEYKADHTKGYATKNLIGSQYSAFRVMYSNAQGAGSFTLTVTAPDGSVILGPSTSNPYLVQQSCDGYSGPAFNDWGAEGV